MSPHPGLPVSIARAASSAPARRTVLTDAVYDALLARLMDHTMEPGDRIGIDQVARDLDVSPTPVREALARLESEGLVQKTPLKGYRASPLLDAAGFADLFEMRLLTEPYASARAAERVDASVLARLEESAAVMQQFAEASSDDSDRTGSDRVDADRIGADRVEAFKVFALEDGRFHQLIADHCGNTLLAEGIARLRAHRHLYRLYFTEGIAAETAREHERILAALRTGDATAAEAAMRTHLACSQRRIEQGFARGVDQT